MYQHFFKYRHSPEARAKTFDPNASILGRRSILTVSSSSGLIFAAECFHCEDEESISAVYLQGPSFLLTSTIYHST
jgi:hypothetical protein